MSVLEKKVVLVTGASRGVGRGIAIGLAHAGATVYATGRSIDQAKLDTSITSIRCDYTDDDAVRRLFDRISAEQSRLDVFVNNAWGATSGWSRTGVSPGPTRSGSSRSGGGRR